MSEYAKYGVLIVAVIILQAVVTVLVSKWLRSLPEKKREAINKGMRPVIKFDQFIWRFILWPMMAALAAWVLYLFFTGQL